MQTVLQSADGVGNELDGELARRASRGDISAFERIMRRYNQRLFRLAVSITADRSEAEDVLQEGYVRAFYALKNFAGRGSVGAWLAQIVRNESIDRLRGRAALRKHEALESELTSDNEESVLARESAPMNDVHFNPQAAIENAEMKQVLEEAIGTLPTSFRGVFMLREVEGLSIEETAEYLGIPAATVRTRDHRARKLLRRHIGEQIDTTLPHTFEFLSTRCDDLVARVVRRIQRQM